MGGKYYRVIFVKPWIIFPRISDVTSEMCYMYEKNDPTGNFGLPAPCSDSILLVSVIGFYTFTLFIRTYTNSFIVTFLASVTKASVFRLIYAFAVI